MAIISTADTKRPTFDIEMELLASAPLEPKMASLEKLAEDLGLRSQQAAKQSIIRLRSRGFDIKISRDYGDGRMVFISREGWGKAQAAGVEYWEKTYPELVA